MSIRNHTSSDLPLLASVVLIALLVAGLLVFEWRSIDNLQRNAVDVARVPARSE